MNKKFLAFLSVLFFVSTLLIAATPTAENVCTRYENIASEFSALATNVSKNPQLFESDAIESKLQKLQQRIDSVSIDAKYLNYDKVSENHVNRITEATRKIEQARLKILSAAQKYMN